MRLTESYIHLLNLRFYAHHGVLPQERATGAEFTVTLRVGYLLEAAIGSDQLADTISYANVYQLVSREMAIPSQLLEHVAGRIAEAVFQAYPEATSIDLWLTKNNPPMGADGQGAGVELHLINDKTG